MFNLRVTIVLVILITLAGCSEKKIFTATGCSIDSVNDSTASTVAMKRSGMLNVAGWAADFLSKKAPETVSINLVSSTGDVLMLAEGKLTVARPDVSSALNAPLVTHAGFGVSANVDSKASGIYELQVLQYFPDRILVCKSAKAVKID